MATRLPSAVLTAVLDLNVIPSDGRVFLLSLANGVSQIEQKTFARHFQDAQTSAPRGKLQIAAHIAARVDDFSVLVDEGCCGRELRNQPAIKFFLRLKIVPVRVRRTSRKPRRARLAALRMTIERKGHHLAGRGAFSGENLVGAIF